jgi:hypothetical protein
MSYTCKCYWYVWFGESSHASWGGESGVHPMKFNGISFLIHLLIISLWGIGWPWINLFHSTIQINSEDEKKLDHLVPQTKHTLPFFTLCIQPPGTSLQVQHLLPLLCSPFREVKCEGAVLCHAICFFNNIFYPSLVTDIGVEDTHDVSIKLLIPPLQAWCMIIWNSWR